VYFDINFEEITMQIPQTNLLSKSAIKLIHETSLRILKEVGFTVHHVEVLKRLSDAGARIDLASKRVWIHESLVSTALDIAPKKYTLYGRDVTREARFGQGDMNMISSPGQFSWFDKDSGSRCNPTLKDVQTAARVGDALPNVTIVGALGVPSDVPHEVRDVIQTLELLKNTTKPSRCWPITRRSSHYVLEMYAAVAGGKQALRDKPMVEVFLEPISPLSLPQTGLDVMLEYLDYGQPVSIGPMSMVTGTGPATLAGTLAQENAEILAGIVTIQLLKPGTPVMYGGIPHVMDPRTSICSFGSAEQGLMAIAMSEIGRSYGFPIYINVNLTDSKTLDIQAGFEKMGSFILGASAGADLFGHAGILGGDHGASLLWLVIDNEVMEYIKRVLRGFEVNEETLAFPVIAEVGPGGNYLTHRHTLTHLRKELWVPRSLWTRDSFENWESKGKTSMMDRARGKLEEVLSLHEVAPLDVKLEQELNKIVDSARRELLD
jgi:trimethylamine---corrinoid protein Co-methyltransferase